MEDWPPDTQNRHAAVKDDLSTDFETCDTPVLITGSRQ